MLCKRYLFSTLFSIFLSIFWIVSPVEAQFFNDASVAQLVLDPEYPAPFSSVEVALDAYSINTTGASIFWYVNGVERPDNRHARNMVLTTGALNEPQEVTVKIAQQNAPAISISKTIIPSETDIVLEANTYIPAFYKGRALPSGNSIVRAVAITHSSDDSPLDSLTYEWKQGQTVLFGGPIKGRNVAEVTMSRYDGDSLSVRVTNAQGELVGGKTILLISSDPELHFYEENPLRGLNPRAISDSLILIGDETTLHAEPYYMVTDLSKRSVLFEWAVDGTRVVTDLNENHTLTLRKTADGGSARVDIRAVTTTTIPQYVQRGFNILF